MLSPFRLNIQTIDGQFQPLLVDFLKYILQQSDENLDATEKYRTLFPVSPTAFDASRILAARHCYADAIDCRIKDGRLSQQERSDLEAIRVRLGLASEIATQVYADRTSKRLGRFIEFITADQRISPLEDERLKAMASSFGISLNTDCEALKVLNRFRALWKLEHAELPIVSTDITLKPNENCHFASNCVWFEYRVTRTNIRYGGIRYSTRLVKGISIYGGTRESQTTHSESLVPIESGKFLLTGGRILFIGNKRSFAIPIRSVVDFTTFKNGITLIRDRGKHPFLEFEYNVDICSMILSQLLDQRDA